jgi:hypothetical protein
MGLIYMLYLIKPLENLHAPIEGCRFGIYLKFRFSTRYEKT